MGRARLECLLAGFEFVEAVRGLSAEAVAVNATTRGRAGVLRCRADGHAATTGA